MYQAKKLILLIIWFLHPIGAYCQNIDSSRIKLAAKMRLLEYTLSYVYAKDELEAFIRYQPDMRELESKGFNSKEYFFFELKIEPYIDTLEIIHFPNGDEAYFTFFSDVVYNFIFGYHKIRNELYLLNTRDGDFQRFYNLNKDICSKRNSYLIEGLDLNCICKSLRRKKKCFKSIYIYNGIIY